ncbi:hypothetical protein MMC21_002253 [Puttea exsequens]|nr:hypothetical protein [Puttea exsequens]
MPVSTSSQSLLATLPSFMSVFGDGANRTQTHDRSVESTEASEKTINFAKKPYNTNSFASPLHRRDSTSTFNESVESSPTTTISTIESSITEPSPSSPPESPESLLPRLSFKNLRTNSVPGQGVMDDRDRKDQFSSSFPTLPGVERAESPNKKMRNMKNLSVNTSASNRSGPPLPKLGLSNQSGASHAFSAPPTPAFIVPPKAPIKKPSQLGLTITTPEATTSFNPGQERPAVITTSTSSDHQIRTLRHLQTSTVAPLFSPTVAPEGGMRLPPFSNPHSGGRFGKAGPPLTVTPRGSLDSSMASPITRQTLEHVKEETDYDLPLSQEAKSPAYPQGPICIHDPDVYLYLEPSHVEARQFDVVLNVAREVKNPFTRASQSTEQEQTQIMEGRVNLESPIASFAGRDSISEPQTASSERTFNSALEAQQEDAVRTAPSTPKATRPDPEYIHVPWDHNTNVVDDLLRLCELIDDRVRQGKRILVHCQCGVSRSASLVVAYGLYKNPQLTVQEAYDAVKNRSRWIGPNMNLIYQLSEFKSKLAKTSISGTATWHSWRNLGSGRSNSEVEMSPGATSGLPSSSLLAPPQKAMSDPSLFGGREAGIERSNSFSPPGSAQLVDTSAAGDITPGPSSAPPDMQWSPSKLPSEHDREDNKTSEQVPPPEALVSNADTLMSPMTMEGVAIEEKEVAPAGGVAQDLLEVVKDLDSSEHSSNIAPAPNSNEIDVDGNKFVLLSPPNLMAPKPVDLDISSPMIATPSDPMESIPPMPGSFPLSPTVEMDIDHSQTFPTLRNSAHTRESAPTTTSIPTHQSISTTLPAGFSSLSHRRPAPLGLHHLPLRQEPPRLNPIVPPQRTFDPDVPPTPSLLSPRAVEFTASPFHRTIAGDLAGSSVFEQSARAQEDDPRSPHQRGEAPVVRNIFDMI